MFAVTSAQSHYLFARGHQLIVQPSKIALDIFCSIASLNNNILVHLIKDVPCKIVGTHSQVFEYWHYGFHMSSDSDRQYFTGDQLNLPTLSIAFDDLGMGSNVLIFFKFSKFNMFTWLHLAKLLGVRQNRSTCVFWQVSLYFPVFSLSHVIPVGLAYFHIFLLRISWKFWGFLPHSTYRFSIENVCYVTWFHIGWNSAEPGLYSFYHQEVFLWKVIKVCYFLKFKK